MAEESPKTPATPRGLQPVSSAFRDAVDMVIIEPPSEFEIELIVEDVLGFYDKDDDNEENIEGAKNSGMNAVIYEGLERLIETLEDFEISMTHPIII